jgi:hypothetical protein
MAQVDGTKSNKRQSLLLPKGTFVNAAQRRIPTADASRQRPISVIGIESVSLAQRPRAGTNNTTRSISNLSEDSQSSDPTPPTVKPLTRTTTGLSRLPSTRKPAGHTRTQSTADGGSRLPSTLSRTGTTATRPTRTNSALPAPSSRPQSMLLAPSSRPNFSTLQQHYSPRKTGAPKPTTASLINSNTAPDVSTTSAALETQFQQTHLLHLTLLHASFPETLNAYITSARNTLARKHASAAGHLSAVREAERENAFRENVAALAEWGGGPDAGLGEHVQALSGVLSEALILCDEQSGRVRGVVGVFGEWAECVGEMWSARDEMVLAKKGGGVEFIDGLGAEWREEASEVRRRLRSLVGIMERLEQPRDGSVVASVVDGVRQLIGCAVEEVDLVIAVEKVVVDMEEEWVDGQLNGMI